jgi:putative SOS response-associated peptidase YedK
MPVILAPEDYGAWLDPTNERPETLSSLLAPFPASEMAAVEVSGYVNRPTNEGPKCIEPMTGPTPGHLF